MKKIAAFFTTLIMAGITILGMHVYSSGKTEFHSPDFGFWTAEQKFQAPEAVKSNLNENSLVIMASSELEHGKGTPYHPQNMFKGNVFQPMLLGAGHYQSLSHAITLAAIEPAMENRKVVLLVSPQWFRPRGILPKAYASRFSESAFIDMLKNKNLSEETKREITDRTINLLSADRTMQNRIISYKKLLIEHEKNPIETAKFKAYNAFLNEKQRQSVLIQSAVDGIRRDQEIGLEIKEPDWEASYANAEKDARKMTSNNRFQISNKYYNWKVKPQLKKRKGSSVSSSYLESPEYKDLKCFLDVCEDLEIEPMIVLLPVNCKWYDYTKFPKDGLAAYYSKVSDTVKEYQDAKLVDLSAISDQDYYLEDTIHIGWKGWVKLDEIIYQFGGKDQGTS